LLHRLEELLLIAIPPLHMFLQWRGTYLGALSALCRSVLLLAISSSARTVFWCSSC